MPLRAASAGLRNRAGCPCHKHLAAIGLLHARDDLHQRGFARAVLAHQQMDLARFDGEVAPAQRRHASEPLLNTFEFEQHQSRFVMATLNSGFDFSDASISKTCSVLEGS